MKCTKQGKLEHNVGTTIFWVRARMVIVVVRSNTMLLRGSRVRAPTHAFIDDGAAMDAWRMWSAH